MSTLHITVGSHDDLGYLFEWIRDHDAINWPLPKHAKIGEGVLFLIPAMVGEIVASGVVRSVPIPSEQWAPKYQAEIGAIQVRSNPIPIGLLQQRLPEWKYLKYARGYTTVPDEYAGA